MSDPFCNSLGRATRAALIGAFLLLQLQPMQAAPPTFDRKAWMEDYAYLKTQLERTYSNLAWFASPQGGVDLPGLDRRTQRALQTAESDADARAALLGFIEGFQDGHLRALPSLQSSVGEVLKPPPAAFDALDADSAIAALGYAPSTSVAFSLPFESLEGSSLECDGLSQPFRASLLTTAKGKKLGLVRIPRFRELDSSPAPGVSAWSAAVKAGHPVDRSAVKETITEAWFQALADRLRRFREEKVEAVIVDVGGNSGGNDSGDWMVRFFTPRAVHSARLFMAASPMASQYFDEQLAELRSAIKDEAKLSLEIRQAIRSGIEAFEQRKIRAASLTCDLTWVWRERRPWKPGESSRLMEAGYASGQLDYFPPSYPGERKQVESFYWAARVDAFRGAWSGPVYVLTDGRTGSSAEMFTAAIRDNGIARTVGTRTVGAGAGFMIDGPPLVLPNARLRFQVPNCLRLRADGTDEVAGIAPDLPVLPTEGENSRARAMRVLAAIEADLPAAGWTK
jgi:hypothetical protein